MQKYSDELKIQILNDYQREVFGYKKLAKKYGMTREAIRGIIINSYKIKKKDLFLNMKNKDDELEYYRTALAYWKTYAENLEEHIKDEKSKKKIRIKTISELQKGNFEVKKLCKASGLSRRTYYYNKNNTTKKDKDKIIIDAINQMPKKIKETYGSVRKSKYLSEQLNIPVNHKKVERICLENNLQSQIRRPKFPKGYYTSLNDNKKNLPKNILDRDFKANKPMEKLATDISFFKVRRGWLYLSVIKDLFNNEIISYKCSHNVNEQLVLDTLMDIEDIENIEFAIMQTDQGVTYTATEFRKMLKEIGITHSMSRKGNCWDNACIESFFGTLKCEIGYHRTLKEGFLTYEQMEKEIIEYIEFFNNTRIQKKLIWKSPVTYRQLPAS